MAAGAVLCAAADSTAVVVAGRAVRAPAPRRCWRRCDPPARCPPAGPRRCPRSRSRWARSSAGVFAEQNWWRVFFWAGVPLAAVAAAAALLAPGAQRRRSCRGARRALGVAAGLTAVDDRCSCRASPGAWAWRVSSWSPVALLLRRRPRSSAPSAVVWAAGAACLAARLLPGAAVLRARPQPVRPRSGALLLGAHRAGRRRRSDRLAPQLGRVRSPAHRRRRAGGGRRPGWRWARSTPTAATP